MVWRRPARRALIATATVVAALLPISPAAAVSAFAGDQARAGGGPAIVGFSPRHGPIRGGTVVQISGGGFEKVAGVSFGGHPARSFRVESENLVTAVTPSVPHGVDVPIVVAAAGGAATSNRDFTFIGCHVPRLRGERVERARKTLATAGCGTGRVVRACDARKPLRVVAESPRPGLWLEPGARIDLRLR